MHVCIYEYMYVCIYECVYAFTKTYIYEYSCGLDVSHMSRVSDIDLHVYMYTHNTQYIYMCKRKHIMHTRNNMWPNHYLNVGIR